jgi:hypothetical protein
LKAADRLLRVGLLFDGQPYGPLSDTTQLHLLNIDRGEHSLAVQVLTEVGVSSKARPSGSLCCE